MKLLTQIVSHDKRTWSSNLVLAGLFLANTIFPTLSQASTLVETIAKVKPSIVGVGTFQPVRQPNSRLVATGFVVGDGYHVITNAHVVDRAIDAENKESLVIFAWTGKRPDMRKAWVLARDELHDLALLRISGKQLPAMILGKSSQVREGQQYAFTGYPLGSVLGLHPATHQGMIASITPIATPALYSGKLDAQRIKQLRNSYLIFQLDATAYPGNSGSPLYDPETGTVVGVVNSVLARDSKETAISMPSGITYAVPSKYILKLLRNRPK